MYIILDGKIEIGVNWDDDEFKAANLKDIALDICVDKNPLEKGYINAKIKRQRKMEHVIYEDLGKSMSALMKKGYTFHESKEK
jgi:hypothetical protein